MAIYSRQPNGLLCRFSSIVDAITDYNMTDGEFIEQYVQDAMESARRDAERILKYHLSPFERIEERRSFLGEMTKEEFDKIVKEMKEPVKEDVDEQIKESHQT